MILVPQEKIDAWTRQGWWGHTTLWDLFQQQRASRADDEAVVDAPNRSDFAHGVPMRWRWRELGDQVDRLSLQLLDAGLRRDDVMVMQLPNCVEMFAAYLACARLGIVVSPIPVQYRAHEIEHILQKTKARAAITMARIGKPESGHAAARMFKELQATHRSLEQVLSWGDCVPDGCVDLGARMARTPGPAALDRLREAERAACVSANDVFTICWTSGTEATPKGVPRSHNEWMVIGPSIIEAGRLREGARLLNPFPLVNMAGISTAFVTWLMVGGTVFQHHPFTLPVFLDQLRAEAIDYTVAPPPILNKLLQNEELVQGIDLQRLKRIGSGSAPLSEWMVRGFRDRYGVEIINYFGSNEGAALSGNDTDIPDPALRAVYFPRAGVEGFEWAISTSRKIQTRLVDLETGQDIDEAGRPGELRFMGPTIFSGYYESPELTSRAFDERGYYKTGDLFEIAGDRCQFYRYVGRSKDLVIRGGMNISSEEIEGLLAGCPGVKEAAVVAVPDSVLGEKVCACIVPTEGARIDLETLTSYLSDDMRIAVYKLPEYLLTLDELPRNPVGKIVKRELREHAAKLARETEVL
ncbi:MAG: short-chain-fatty-acid--CoA ligase [Variovorax paradoxus]|uniref:Short-chain-fatty-acid--CoA ligase n=1 Tax=Variovorax paradoxus TaxID=34073 RepID=A0A2W5QM80_VARPD|nr:MAG: short-chain-fatty-acid--CoA ligase [Variovorax paradoxus]